MARKVKRRKSATRRGRPKSLPPAAILGAGLVAGILVVLLVQFVIERTRQPDSGLRNLINTSKQQKKPAPAPASSKEKSSRNTRFDFYTILPEIETVVPEQEIEQAKQKKPPATANIRYIVQAGSFSNFGDAAQLKAQLALNGLVAEIQKVEIGNRGVFHRVRLGPYSGLGQVDGVLARLRPMGIKPLVVKLKKEG